MFFLLIIFMSQESRGAIENNLQIYSKGVAKKAKKLGKISTFSNGNFKVALLVPVFCFTA